jgi:hypothetical protein
MQKIFAKTPSRLASCGGVDELTVFRQNCRLTESDPGHLSEIFQP